MKKIKLICFTLACACMCAGAQAWYPPPPPPPPPHHHSHGSDFLTGALTIFGAMAIANTINNSSQQRQQPQYVVVQQPKNRIVYWCDGERGFFPQVKSCPTGWKEYMLTE